jgi:hypothetical protein
VAKLVLHTERSVRPLLSLATMPVCTAQAWSSTPGAASPRPPYEISDAPNKVLAVPFRTQKRGLAAIAACHGRT